MRGTDSRWSEDRGVDASHSGRSQSWPEQEDQCRSRHPLLHHIHSGFTEWQRYGYGYKLKKINIFNFLDWTSCDILYIYLFCRAWQVPRIGSGWHQFPCAHHPFERRAWIRNAVQDLRCTAKYYARLGRAAFRSHCRMSGQFHEGKTEIFLRVEQGQMQLKLYLIGACCLCRTIAAGLYVLVSAAAAWFDQRHAGPLDKGFQLFRCCGARRCSTSQGCHRQAWGKYSATDWWFFNLVFFVRIGVVILLYDLFPIVDLYSLHTRFMFITVVICSNAIPVLHFVHLRIFWLIYHHQRSSACILWHWNTQSQSHDIAHKSTNASCPIAH